MNTPIKSGALYRGVYHTEQECLADKPEDHGAVTYVCQEVVRQPLDE